MKSLSFLPVQALIGAQTFTLYVDNPLKGVFDSTNCFGDPPSVLLLFYNWRTAMHHTCAASRISFFVSTPEMHNTSHC